MYNGFRVLNTPAELTNTAYGWVLTTKLCFVGLAVALGGWNRLVGFPAAIAIAAVPDDSKKALHVITSILRIESIALLIVLCAAAVLTTSAPPTSNRNSIDAFLTLTKEVS